MRKLSEIALGFNELELGMIWPKIVGEKIAQRSSPRKLNRGVLTISVLSPSWSHHINALRHDIMRNVSKMIGISLKKIVLVSSTSSSNFRSDIPFYNEGISYSFSDRSGGSSLKFSEIEDSSLRERFKKIFLISDDRKRRLENLFNMEEC